MSIVRVALVRRLVRVARLAGGQLVRKNLTTRRPDDLGTCNINRCAIMSNGHNTLIQRELATKGSVGGARMCSDVGRPDPAVGLIAAGGRRRPRPATRQTEP